MTEQQKEEKFARPFADFLQDQARAHGELTDGLHDLIAAVEDTGKPGTLTLKIKVEPDKGGAGVLRVSDTVTVTKPAHDRPRRIYYKDKAGNLSRTDPNQLELSGLRDVSAPAVPAELKEVN
ncbi:hypothetical protein [Acaricomes phytoseiuli]|uniref:hypothetical protein n=1 Tax=Acaricomes phytoseiuli TaxID=291968 RepID=UPI00036852A5|nr:hypothetical protein [Acaricomes phytoseiuli]